MKKLLPISATVIMLLAVACGGSRENYTPSYTSGQSVVNIHFTEYDSVNNGYIEAFLNGYDGLGEIPPTKVNNDGSVSLTFDLNGDAVLRLMNSVTGDNIGAIRIAPGETTDVTIFPDSLSTTGKYAQLNSVMYKYVPKYSLNIFNPDFISYNMTGDEYTEALLNKYKILTDSLASDNTLSAEEKYLEESAQLNSLLMFMSNRNLINRCSYIMTHQNMQSIPYDSLTNGVSDENYATVIAAIDPNSELLLGGGNDISTSLNEIDWTSKGASGTLLGAISDYQLAAKEASACRTDSVRVSNLTSYSNPFFATAIDNIRQSAQKRYDDAVSMINQIPTDLEGDKIVETIVAPYKGKVVMIDLWNTWCSPCKAAIAENEPLKSTVLSDPDIVWVYIADESSPMNVYVNQIPKIKGEHYRITAKQAEALHKQFDLDGIPYYILVDREGNFKGRPDLRDHDLYIKSLLETVNKK